MRSGSDTTASIVAANLAQQERYEFIYSDARDSMDFYKYQKIVYDKDMQA